MFTIIRATFYQVWFRFEIPHFSKFRVLYSKYLQNMKCLIFSIIGMFLVKIIHKFFLATHL